MTRNRLDLQLSHAALVSIVMVIICLGSAASGAFAQEGSMDRASGEDESSTEPGAVSAEELSRAEDAARNKLLVALAEDGGIGRWFALKAILNLKDPQVAEQVVPICMAPDLTERVLAMEIVTNNSPRLGKEAFIDALQSGERSIRLRGLLGLAAIGDTDSLQRIISMMEEDPDPDIRAMAARTLGEIGEVKASMALFDALESLHPPVREQALLALLKMEDEDVGRHLLSMLAEADWPIEADVLRLLALVPDPSLIEDIEPYLENENYEVRYAAAAAILSILEKSAPPRP